MSKTLNIKADIGPDREIRVTLPDDIPVGPAEITMIVNSVEEDNLPTLGEFLESEFFGMWKDRLDITDSAEFAAELRKKAWKRKA